MLVVFFKKKANFLISLEQSLHSSSYFWSTVSKWCCFTLYFWYNVFLDICEVFLFFFFVAIVFFCRFYIKYQLMNCLFFFFLTIQLKDISDQNQMIWYIAFEICLFSLSLGFSFSFCFSFVCLFWNKPNGHVDKIAIMDPGLFW